RSVDLRVLHSFPTRRSSDLLEAFADAVERCEDPALREVLSKLCDLHALAELERDRAWFQEHGRISSTRAKAITKRVNELCAELRDRKSTRLNSSHVKISYAV